MFVDAGETDQACRNPVSLDNPISTRGIDEHTFEPTIVFLSPDRKIGEHVTANLREVAPLEEAFGVTRRNGA